MTTYYFVGFAYLMMRRYQDAIRTFVNILLYIQRTKQVGGPAGWWLIFSVMIENLVIGVAIVCL